MAVREINLITHEARFADGTFNFVFARNPAQPYMVGTSHDSRLCEPIVTNALDNLGDLHFSDAAAASRPQSFYRIRAQ